MFHLGLHKLDDYIKYRCSICLWNKREKNRHYCHSNWPRRTVFVCKMGVTGGAPQGANATSLYQIRANGTVCRLSR